MRIFSQYDRIQRLYGAFLDQWNFKKYLLDEDGGPVQSISSYVKSLHHAVAAQANV